MGSWVKGKIVGFNGSMAIVDTGTVIVRVNQTKLRKDFDKLPKVSIPLGEPREAPRERAEDQVRELASTSTDDPSNGSANYTEGNTQGGSHREQRYAAT